MDKQEAIRKLKSEPYKAKPDQKFEILRMEPQDAWGVVRCFFAQFGEYYPFDVYYVPERLIEENRCGNLHSVVARAENGDIIGYGALHRSSAHSSRVYEIGQAVILPEYRSTFAAWSLQDFILYELAPGEDIDAIFQEAVTNHVITQRMALIADFSETGIEVGLMPVGTYRNERFPDDRVSTVLSFKCVRDEQRAVYVPGEYAQALDYILSGLDISRHVIASDSKAPAGITTELQTQFFDFAQVARLNVYRIGEDFPGVLAARERQAQDNAFQVVQVYVNLGDAWAGWAISVLREKGYFFGGFLPRWFDSDGMLMQKLVSLPNFDSIVLYFERAQSFLDFIRRDVGENPACRALLESVPGILGNSI